VNTVETPESVQLDLRGEVCPFLLVRTKQALLDLSRGARLEVTFDYPLACKTLPRWAKSEGFRASAAHKIGEGLWRLALGKEEEAPKGVAPSA